MPAVPRSLSVLDQQSLDSLLKPVVSVTKKKSLFDQDSDEEGYEEVPERFPSNATVPSDKTPSPIKVLLSFSLVCPWDATHMAR